MGDDQGDSATERPGTFDTASILSHGERDVARRLADGEDVETIASRRAVSEASVEKAIDRIREKTDRAVATLLQSPFAADAVAALDEADRDRLRSALDR